MKKNFFYHSFARNGNDDYSFQVLENIVLNGLLVTPEKLKLPNKRLLNIEPPLQTRLCFTFLEEGDLEEHSKLFGRFSIEFDLSISEKWCLMPVMYLPIFNSKNSDSYPTAGLRLIEKMLALHQEYRDDQSSQSMSLEEKENSNVVCGFFEHLESMLYPVDNLKYNSSYHYYMQREWRLTGQTKWNGNFICDLLNESQKEFLLNLNNSFFSKRMKMGNGTDHACVNLCYYFKLFEGKHVLSFARKIYVPYEFEARVRDLLVKNHFDIDVVPTKF